MRICVYCGSSAGARPLHAAAAARLGAELADADIAIVYGGASVGLMGALADAALARGGEVIGVMPRALADRELAHDGLSQLHLVDSMHERKALMAQLADAFVALPGGLGTLEELFEIWTWARLGQHRKPCAMLNVDGYYDGLLGFLDHAVGEGFIRAEHRAGLLVAHDSDSLVTGIRAALAV
ncbi:TIGR00730 family Rossman fold protein [Solimonas terrae]|uniref:Cytokinin riboside 5'-monophosphate phosphoribohydrolase n=1 Tax=Solimonas terrae TaxID=1396819 RepID=A0A6M2BTL4_9GAMM|nr:TIGR00730 family Rossman fold protein [Solimonas terrae]NGY05565.1 TIGR00730 family Rossman fold protein [Solimonas terrae]